MGSVVDMKQRVTTAKATLKASALSERNRDVRIMGLLETVEKNIAHKQQQISDLKLQKREQGMGLDEMENLMDRLDKMASPALQP